MCKIEDQTKFYNSKAEKTGWRDFIRPDFIKNLLPYGPVLNLLHARGVSPTALRACRLNPLAIRISSVRKSASILELKGLKVKWLNRINVRRLSWDFISPDFINLPSCQAAKLPNFGKSLTAFTMAEILISLTIIGVIAAITLPSLRANINEKTWATQRKALYSRMSQAIAMMPSLNGYGIGANDTETRSKAAEVFVTDGLSKVLKINNICRNTELSKCGIASKYKNAGGVKKDFPVSLYQLNHQLSGNISIPGNSYTHMGSISLVNTNAAAFETINGESVAVFYQPNCKYDSFKVGEYVSQFMCANFIYDLNGKKGPNMVGKDMGFITAFYPTDSKVVMPIPLNKDSAQHQTYANALKVCRNAGSDLRLPNQEELASIAVNELFLGNLKNGGTYATINNYKILTGWLIRTKDNYGGGISVRCIKR